MSMEFNELQLNCITRYEMPQIKVMVYILKKKGTSIWELYANVYHVYDILVDQCLYFKIMSIAYKIIIIININLYLQRYLHRR